MRACVLACVHGCVWVRERERITTFSSHSWIGTPRTDPESVLVSDSRMSCERWEKPHPCTQSGNQAECFSPTVRLALVGFQTQRTGGEGIIL